MVYFKSGPRIHYFSGMDTYSDFLLYIVHRSKMNAVRMLAVVVVMFAFSWLPLYVLRLNTLFGT